MKWFFLVSGFLCGLVAPSAVQAQGLIWSLPKDGEWVRYEGTYQQEVKRPTVSEGDLTIEFKKVVTLKSVGVEEAEYEGTTQPCRWVEIKAVTGKPSENGLDVGPGGVRLYKVLIPESAVKGEVFQTVEDERKIHVSLIPIVKGFRKIGDGDVEEVESGALKVYPLIALLRHYQDLEETNGEESVQVPAGTFPAVTYQGTMVTETPVERSINTGEIVRSDKIPFGVVKWTAQSVVENKSSTAPRSDFTESMSIREQMEAVEVGTDAESELQQN
jgi:hypothetical protein